jgi:hypothetical protein
MIRTGSLELDLGGQHAGKTLLNHALDDFVLYVVEVQLVVMRPDVLPDVRRQMVDNGFYYFYPVVVWFIKL